MQHVALQVGFYNERDHARLWSQGLRVAIVPPGGDRTLRGSPFSSIYPTMTRPPDKPQANRLGQTRWAQRLRSRRDGGGCLTPPSAVAVSCPRNSSTSSPRTCCASFPRTRIRTSCSISDSTSAEQPMKFFEFGLDPHPGRHRWPAACRRPGGPVREQSPEAATSFRLVAAMDGTVSTSAPIVRHGARAGRVVEPPSPGCSRAPFGSASGISEPVTPLRDLALDRDGGLDARLSMQGPGSVPRPYHVGLHGWYFIQINFSGGARHGAAAC